MCRIIAKGFRFIASEGSLRVGFAEGGYRVRREGTLMERHMCHMYHLCQLYQLYQLKKPTRERSEGWGMVVPNDVVLTPPHPSDVLKLASCLGTGILRYR